MVVYFALFLLSYFYLIMNIIPHLQITIRNHFRGSLFRSDVPTSLYISSTPYIWK